MINIFWGVSAIFKIGVSEIITTENKVDYIYRVYGLDVKSDIILPELITLENNMTHTFDVTISLGNVPEHKENPKVKFENYFISDNELYFHVYGVAKYYIADGDKIIVEPEEDANIDDIKTYLLGSAFGAILIQRNIVAIHGGAMMVNGKIMIFTGDMGAGKSTLTSALRLDGNKFLADDVSVIGTTKEGVTVVYPGYPQQKLCKDIMLKFGYDTTKFKKINSDRNKFALPVLGDFVKEPIQLGSIIELTVGDVDEVKIAEMKGSEKLKVIYKNIYRKEFIDDTGLRPAYFKNFINVVKKVSLYRITRPKDIFSIERQIELIHNTITVKEVTV
jgi:hypothetical protein